MIKVFAFDLDGTLTQHKTPLEEENRRVLEKLSKKYRLLMVGAGSCERIHRQLGQFPMDVIGNYGMQYAKYTKGRLSIVRDDRVEVRDIESLENRVSALRAKHGFTVFKGENVEYHASGCVTFPILGTKADQVDKLAFDPDRKKRRSFYGEVISTFPEYNVFVGGSSSFDMAPKPFNKYYALDLWCKENGFSHSEVAFVGDDYGIGGNDESVYRSDFRFITIDDYRRLGEVLAPWVEEGITDIDSLLMKEVDCNCGKKHYCDIEKVLIRNGAINELPAITYGYKSILLVSDRNTYNVCGERIKELLSEQIGSEIMFTCDGFLVPDENAIVKIEECLKNDTDLIIGIGSGVINDLCKYVSHAHLLPYFIVCTAPSMDGYASKGAAMLLQGMKVTTNANVPRVIIADTAILKNAPIEMLKSGYGDIIGKYSCLNDWKLSELVNGEPLCEYIYNLTHDTVSSVSGMAKAILTRDEKSVAALMRALVIVGIAMAYMGNSRPASGSEHHLSHYFEVVGLVRNQPYFCHGTDVAYSTYVTAMLRRKLLEIEVPKEKPFDESEWEKEIIRVYGGNDSLDTAKGVIAMQKKLGWIYESKISAYSEKWQQIKEVLADSPAPEEILAMLSDIELPMNDFYCMYPDSKIPDAITCAKYLKDRYSVLWLYDQILISWNR